MSLERRLLARVDRRLLSETDHDEVDRMVKLPVSDAVWSTWRRYCDAAGVHMGRGLAILLHRELASVVDEDLEGLAALLKEREARISAKEAELSEREAELGGREKNLARRESLVPKMEQTLDQRQEDLDERGAKELDQHEANVATAEETVTEQPGGLSLARTSKTRPARAQ